MMARPTLSAARRLNAAAAVSSLTGNMPEIAAHSVSFRQSKSTLRQVSGGISQAGAGLKMVYRPPLVRGGERGERCLDVAFELCDEDVARLRCPFEGGFNIRDAQRVVCSRVEDDPVVPVGADDDGDTGGHFLDGSQLCGVHVRGLQAAPELVAEGVRSHRADHAGFRSQARGGDRLVRPPCRRR